MSWFQTEPAPAGGVDESGEAEPKQYEDVTVEDDGTQVVEGDARHEAVGLVPDAVDERNVKEAGGERKVKQGRAPNKKKADRPAVPTAAVKSLVGMVDVLRDGFLPLGKLVAETGSSDVYAVASALTELKVRRRMQQFVQAVERFGADSEEDRIIDMALAMQGDSGLTKRLYAVVEATGGEGSLGRPYGAGRERDDAKRIAGAWDVVDVERLKALVY